MLYKPYSLSKINIKKQFTKIIFVEISFTNVINITNNQIKKFQQSKKRLHYKYKYL